MRWDRGGCSYQRCAGTDLFFVFSVHNHNKHFSLIVLHKREIFNLSFLKFQLIQKYLVFIPIGIDHFYLSDPDMRHMESRRYILVIFLLIFKWNKHLFPPLSGPKYPINAWSRFHGAF